MLGIRMHHHPSRLIHDKNIFIFVDYHLVRPAGIEPAAFSMSTKRSTTELRAHRVFFVYHIFMINPHTNLVLLYILLYFFQISFKSLKIRV